MVHKNSYHKNKGYYRSKIEARMHSNTLINFNSIIISFDMPADFLKPLVTLGDKMCMGEERKQVFFFKKSLDI